MRVCIALIVSLAACSSSKPKGDECQQMVDKSAKVLDEIAKLRNRSLTADDRTKLVAQCREGLAAGKRDPSMDCVLAAKSDAEIRDCYMKGFASYRTKSMEIEGKVALKGIGRIASEELVDKGAFPTGKVGPTPATPCCQQPDQQCAPNAADWSDPIWQALFVEQDRPFRFQYSYESDGKTFTATAVADLACDGNVTTHTVTGAIDASGQPTITNSWGD